MITTSLPRRALVGAVLSAGLVGTGLVSFAADPAVSCPSWVDAQGDAVAGGEPTGLGADAQMDIVNATFGTIGKSLVGTITTDGLSDSSSDFGDELRFAFTVGGAHMLLYADRVTPMGAPVDATAGFYNLDTEATGAATATYDVSSKTVTLTGPISELGKALGKPAEGLQVSELSAQSSDQLFGAAVLEYDDAPTVLTPTVGQSCPSVPAPAAKPAPKPSAKPAGKPSSKPKPNAPTSTAAGDPSKPPKAGCFLAKDPKGDAHVINGQVPNDPDLDLTGLTLGSDGKNLYGWFKVDKLGAGPQIHDGHRFYLNFTFNKHTFTAAGSSFAHDGSADLKDGLAETGQVAHVTQLAVDGVSSATDPERVTGNGPGFVESGLKYVFDQKTSTVEAILPVADIEKYGKAKVAGATLTSVYAGSYGDTYAVASGADQLPDGVSSPDDAKLTYRIGDNACFGR